MNKGFSKKANKSTQVDQGITEELPLRPVANVVKRAFVPTEEQQFAEKLFTSIHKGVVKIAALAGSGKSTTLYYLGGLDKRPSLGLVFGKDMAVEAREKSPSHIDWRSTHSLAYRKFGSKYQHKLSRPSGRYINVAGTGGEIARYFRIPQFDLDENSFISQAFIGLIIKETVGAFETSVEEVVGKEHVPYHHIRDLQKRHGDLFPKKKFVSLIVRRAKDLWEERKDLYSDCLITHNTYLKLFHLSNPDLSLEYSVIYVDEAQDLNPVTLDIVMRQQDKCKIVLVGDHFQSIFQFNGAVNAMAAINGKEAALTKSFRFGQPIADVATAILQNKAKVLGNEDIKSHCGTEDVVDESKPYTILFRGNMELIFTAVKAISEGKDVQVYVDLREFVGMVTSAKELKAGNLKGVKSENIIPFATWDELKNEGKSDPALGRLVSIIEGDDADRIVTALKGHRNDTKAHITMLTAHKSKGLEWEQVVLANDFVSNYNSKGKWVGLSDQERNLLYVAATRAEKVLQYNKPVQELLDVLPVKCEMTYSEYEEERLPNEGYEVTRHGKEYYAVPDEDGVECLYGSYTHYLAVNHDNTNGSVDVNCTVQTLESYEMGMFDTGGLISPKGLHAQDAVNRGIDEYMNDKDEGGLTQYDLLESPWTLEDMTKEIYNLSKDL